MPTDGVTASKAVNTAYWWRSATNGVCDPNWDLYQVGWNVWYGHPDDIVWYALGTHSSGEKGEYTSVSSSFFTSSQFMVGPSSILLAAPPHLPSSEGSFCNQANTCI